MKKIAVIGTGYVGLVTGTCFAELGNEVTCLDIDEQKVTRMNAGQIPIYEPGLEELFSRNLQEGRLHITLDLKVALQDATVVFLALPTPMSDDGSANLSYIYGVANQLGPLLQNYTVVVDKSTVPVGTAEAVRARIAAQATVDFDVVSNPEFLREGLAIQDFMEPDRIVIGSASERARQVMADLYEPITRNNHPLFFMSPRSAEMTKYAANSFLAAKLTFMNQIANLCERLEADAEDVRIGIGSDSRIGNGFLFPGIGYGGSCFPKDIQALIHMAEAVGMDFPALKTVADDNQRQKQVLSNKIKAYFGDNLSGKTLAMWGLAFKPETDDIREAPSLEIIQALTTAGASVQAFDPEAMENVGRRFPGHARLKLVDNAFAALEGADALLLVTEWRQFAAASPERIKKLLRRPVIFDGRNMFDPLAMRRAGFYYEGIGRPMPAAE